MIFQPQRIKYKKWKVGKKLYASDVIGIFLVFCISLFLSQIIFINQNEWFKWISFVIFMISFSILLLPSKKNNCRIYTLIFRMFKYWLSPKRYGKNSNREATDLNPYDKLVSLEIVKNKNFKSFSLIPKNDLENYFYVLKVYGHNIWVEDAEEQEIMIYNFAKLINTFNDKVSIVQLWEKVDFSKNIEFIQKCREKKLSSPKVANNDELIEFWNKYYDRLITDFRNLNTDEYIQNHYLIINGSSLQRLEENYMSLQILLEESSTISAELLSGFDLLKFLNQLNKFEAADEEIRNFVNDEDNINKDYSLDDLFKYKSVVFQKDTLLINNKLHSIQCLNKLPLKLKPGWIKNIFNCRGTVVWTNSPYLGAEKFNKLLDKATRKNEDMQMLTDSTTSRAIGTYDEQAIDTMIEQVNAEEWRVFDTNFFVIVEAKDKKELKEKLLKNANETSKANILLNTLYWRQFYGFLDIANYPDGKLEREAYQITAINLAYGYPFEYDFLNDQKDMLLGYADLSRSPVSFDYFKLDGHRKNHNILIAATSGSGKTTMCQKMLTSSIAANNQAIIIDPQAEYLDWCKTLGGQIIDFGTGKKTTFNPLQVRNSIREDDDGDSMEIIINNHLNWLEKYFNILLELKDNQWITLETYIKQLYETKGIYQLKKLSEWTNKDWPTMSDLIKFMKKTKISKEDEYIKVFVVETIKFLEHKFENNGPFSLLYNGHTNISINNDLVVFKNDNLTDTSGSVAARLGIMCIISLINEFTYANWLKNKQIEKQYKLDHNVRLLSSSIRDQLITRTSVLIDEEHIYISPSNLTTLEYITNTVKTFRKFDAGVVNISQDLADWTQTLAIADIAKRIISNCQYYFFLGSKAHEIKKIDELFSQSLKLKRSDINFLTSDRIGKALVSISARKRLRIFLHYNNFEKELFFAKGIN